MSAPDKSQGNSKQGAVAVVGAGIGGMQASLDLANAGFKVYLIEKGAAIGGKMAQLDKTFPTNDCAMCIISPKLVEVGRHADIELLTHTEVTGLDGIAGNFKVDLHTRAKFVDPKKCTGCGECAIHCPVVLPNEFDEGLSNKKAISKRFPQAIPNAFSIAKVGTAPCRMTCPTNVSVQGYVALVAEGRFEEAMGVIRDQNPFPSICGRVCHHPCEGECNRAQIDEAVAINPLKRFVSDWVFHQRKQGNLAAPPKKGEIDPEKKDRKVAVIGGGPAGMVAARDLALRGYPVTLFEKMDRLGGTMRMGIPDYRLPQEMLQRDIDDVLAAGFEVKYNQELGKDFTFDSLKNDGFKAAYLSIGCTQPVSLPLNTRGEKIKGADLQNVHLGLDFLRDIKLGKNPRVEGKVVVVGGGNVAIDVAMSAKRQGADQVEIVSLECQEEMPAHEWEVKDALDEGIQLNPSWGIFEILDKNGKVTGMKLERCTCVFDTSGRFAPEFETDCFSETAADHVIIAIGQRSDFGFLKDDDPLWNQNKRFIQADKVTLQTNVDWIFAGGDMVTGPRSVVEGIRQGHEGAESVDRFLSGKNLAEGRPEKLLEKAPVPDKKFEKIPRHLPEKLPVKDRKGYVEIEQTFDEASAVAEAKRCLACGVCSECFLCVEHCQAGAVFHEDVPRDFSVEVGSIVLAPGFETFDPNIRGEFGYGRFPNVVTSIEFERILSASGPYQGHVLRPSDRQEPKNVAWIQCVGSRDSSCGNDYCSSVCCMYAVKEAVIAVEHMGKLDTSIFYMELRAFGKGFDEYVARAEKSGVRFVRSMVSRVIEDPLTHDLTLRYVNESGEEKSESFDMVVLSVGMQIPRSVMDLGERLGVDMTINGFAKTGPFAPLETNVPGVFVAGAFAGPKDIPETVAEASAAAACASGTISSARHTQITKVDAPPEISVEGVEPRVGVFVCHCGINISSIVNVNEVMEYAKTLPFVAHADQNLYTCSQDTQEKIKALIAEHNLNRVVVASCSPRTHEPLFMQTLAEAGLNPFLFDMANIRDQCSWVNRADKVRATAKSKDLVRMAVSNAAYSHPLYDVTVKVTPRCLIIGGGLAGMTAAVELSKQGFESVIVERSDRLGGNLWNLRYTSDGSDVRSLLNGLVDKVNADRKIRVLTNALVVDFTGYVGCYETEVMIAAMRSEKIQHGTMIIATGGGELSPAEYRYGQDDQVITQTAFERILADEVEQADRFGLVAMIQCVGSREETRSYCSRICCNQALKNALLLKKRNPKSRIVIFYRDIRSYGLNESLYTQARKEGVLFIRYEPQAKPEVSRDQTGLLVEAFDGTLGAKVKIRPDLLVLSAASMAGENEELGALLKLARNEYGFFIEAHQKLRPVDFASDGIYLAGLAHGPKSISESISQAQAAVARACTILAYEEKSLSGIISCVDPEKCAVCLTCVRACPYGVPTIHPTDSTAVIDPAMCHGCGICAAECPGKAIELNHFRDSQLLAKTNALYERSEG